MSSSNVCVIGLWHLASVTATCLAYVGHNVVGVDQDTRRIADLNSGRPPLYEPGLSELLAQQLSAKRIWFTTNFSGALEHADYTIIAFDTPVDENDRVDITPVLQSAKIIARKSTKYTTVVVMSQVPVGTCEKIKLILNSTKRKAKLDLAYCPENLKLGSAIQRFLAPPVLVIGCEDSQVASRLTNLFSGINAPKLITDIKTAEMIKHTWNAFSAACISFTNEIAALSERIGVDGMKVVEALRYDKRTGPETPLQPGLGFSGGTLARDLHILVNLGSKVKCRTPFLNGVLERNMLQNAMVTEKIMSLYPGRKGLRLSVLGLTYKAGTSTLRRSIALQIVKKLVEMGNAVKVYDPKADLSENTEQIVFEISTSPYDAATGADAILLLTDWPEFRKLDFQKLGQLVKKRIIIDTKNFFDPMVLRKAGFDYYGVGRQYAGDTD